MLFLRTVVLLMLGASLVCFVVYATTGKAQYRALGTRLVKWTVVAGLVFFGVLIFERVVPFF
ncbi:MAG: hypothetical protein M3Y67_10075 [Pseudomonadota bacterium]|nr:hypothetical protein [Pseudomonadota bacterium]